MTTLPATKFKAAVNHALKVGVLIHHDVGIRWTHYTVEVTAISDDQQITVLIDNDSEDTGSIQIPAMMLKPLIKGAVKDKDVTLTMESVTVGNSTVRAPDNPLSMDIVPPLRHRAVARVDHPRWQQVVTSAATDDSRPVLACVHLTNHNNKLMLESADGFRMSTLKLRRATRKPVDMLIPAQALRNVPKGKSLTIYEPEDEDHATIQYKISHGMTVYNRVRLVDGSYPDLSAILLNRDNDTATLELRSDDLIAAAEYAKASGENNVVQFMNEYINIPGRNDQDMMITGYDHGLPVDEEWEPFLALNGEYLRWLAQGVDMVHLTYQSKNAPVTVYDDALTMLVMPMLLS